MQAEYHKPSSQRLKRPHVHMVVCDACGTERSPVVVESAQRSSRQENIAPTDVSARLHTVGTSRSMCQGVCWPSAEYGDGDEFHTRIAELAQHANVAAIVAGMHRHIRHRRAQEAACQALVSLSYDAAQGDERRNKLVELGGVEVVLLSMTVHTASESLQEWACRIVYILAADYQSPAEHARVLGALERAGCVERIIAAMAAHPQVFK